jgi:hypothetical protein
VQDDEDDMLAMDGSIDPFLDEYERPLQDMEACRSSARWREAVFMAEGV